jgi:hypothetical protein
MNDKAKKDQPFHSKHIQMTLNIIMISVMMTCFAVIIEKVIREFYPMWGLYWFPVYTFLLTALNLLMRQAQRKTPRAFSNQTLFILTEIVLIILITKAISMVVMMVFGYLSIWQEITSWSNNFLEHFFNLDFLLRASGIFLIWLLIWLFSAPLNKMEEDHALMEQEKLGYTFTDRYDARRKLIHLIFNIGLLMIILMVMWKSNLPWFYEESTSTRSFLLVLLAYFFTAFLFLALNQYAIMKARWFFSDIEVNPELAKHWLFYSLFFILSVILVIVFLPTNLPLGISTIADWLSEAFLYISSLLFSILTFPIFLILALISRLFGRDAIVDSFQPMEPRTDILPQTIGSTPWLDIVQSIIFWLVFAGVVISAITFYIRNRPNLNLSISDLKLFALIKEFLHWISRGLKEAKSASSETIQKGLEKFQTFLRTQKRKLPTLIDLAKKLPPRQAVIVIYMDWILWNRHHGFTRKESQTPYEYAQAYLQQLPEMADQDENISELTDVFIQARYSRRQIFQEQAQEAQNLSKHLKKSFRLKDDLPNLKESQP